MRGRKGGKKVSREGEGEKERKREKGYTNFLLLILNRVCAPLQEKEVFSISALVL